MFCVAVNDAIRRRRPVVRMQDVHCHREIPQPANMVHASIQTNLASISHGCIEIYRYYWSHSLTLGSQNI